MKEIVLLSLGIGLISNALLSFGMGIKALQNRSGSVLHMPYSRVIILFISIPVLWLFISYALGSLGLYYLEILLLFPLTVMLSIALRVLVKYIFPKYDDNEQKSVYSGYDGLVLLGSFLALRLAHTFIEALFVSLGFSFSYLLIVFLLGQIIKRSSVEAIPDFLRGIPIVLISAGLLAMIFSIVTSIFLKIAVM